MQTNPESLARRQTEGTDGPKYGGNHQRRERAIKVATYALGMGVGRGGRKVREKGSLQKGLGG